jgi:predicted anti-sigma-YlaC factor YlaD
MTTNELTCQELVELVTDYIEGAMSPAERERFEQHLASCSGCRNYLDQMQQTIRALGKNADEGIAPDARNVLLDLFRDWKQGQGPSH